MLLMIDNYDSFTFNLVQYLQALGAEVKVVRNDAMTVDEIAGLAPERIVISPGPCTPNEAGVSLEVISRMGATTPILGVCLGHQSIGQAYGGKVVRYDDSATLKVPGVVKVIEIAGSPLPSEYQPLGGVAVVARNTWAAIKGREALKVEWNDGPNAAYESRAYRDSLSKAAHAPGKVVRTLSDEDVERMRAPAAVYQERWKSYAKGLRPIAVPGQP